MNYEYLSDFAWGICNVIVTVQDPWPVCRFRSEDDATGTVLDVMTVVVADLNDDGKGY